MKKIFKTIIFQIATYFFYYQKILAQPIVILCTAALITNQYEERKKEYITSLQILQKQKLPVFVVENCCLNGYSFLDSYCANVFYCTSNNTQFKNKGVNEAIALLHAFNYFLFDEETIILKLTGRYSLNNFNFINLIENTPSCDAFICCDNYAQVFTGCFAMRCKFFKDMLKNLDLMQMEKEMINIERAVANYINKYISKEKIYSITSLGISANIFGNGSNQTLIEK